MPRETTQHDHAGPKIRVFPTREDATREAARILAERMEEHRRTGRNVVLGLATGRSPTGVYAELVRLHQAGLSFSNVVSFNLDEYYPCRSDADFSYHRYMRNHLFDHVDIRPGAWALPDGTVPEERVESYCREYEGNIAGAGGVDLQLLGLGRTGHVGFNEPGSGRDSRTRVVTLHPTTLSDNAPRAGRVPARAITVGIATILEARRILLLAFGAHKAGILKRALLDPVTPEVPASFLREHRDVTVLADEAAAGDVGDLLDLR